MNKQLTRQQWVLMGGVKNLKLFRKQRGKYWTYWEITG